MSVLLVKGFTLQLVKQVRVSSSPSRDWLCICLEANALALGRCHSLALVCSCCLGLRGTIHYSAYWCR